MTAAYRLEQRREDGRDALLRAVEGHDLLERVELAAEERRVELGQHRDVVDVAAGARVLVEVGADGVDGGLLDEAAALSAATHNRKSKSTSKSESESLSTSKAKANARGRVEAREALAEVHGPVLRRQRRDLGEHVVAQRLRARADGAPPQR